MSWWRKMLNLPPKGERWADQRKPPRKRGRAEGARDPHQAPEQDRDWWQHPGEPTGRPAPRRRSAGTATATAPPPVEQVGPRPVQPPAGRTAPRLGDRSGDAVPPRDPYRASEIPWSTEPESSFASWGRRFLRGLVVVVLLLAAASGVRSWIRPADDSTPAVSPESSYPRAEAQAVAARFATSYLTWDETDRDARAAATGLDLAAGLDKQAGWNGIGIQHAGTAYPGEVKVGPEGVTAQVDVRVEVTPYTKNGANWLAGKPLWTRLSVPVARTATRVVVSGSPTLVSDVPDALPDNMPGTGATDEELTNLTEKDAEAFFDAYATSDAAVAAVAAPGSSITSLNGLVRLGGLKSWQVYAGNDDERRATAAVTWAGSGKTTLDQSYTVTLRRTVAANGAERWQVAAIG
jgi:hypothetical protein